MYCFQCGKEVSAGCELCPDCTAKVKPGRGGLASSIAVEQPVSINEEARQIEVAQPAVNKAAIQTSPRNYKPFVLIIALIILVSIAFAFRFQIADLANRLPFFKKEAVESIQQEESSYTTQRQANQAPFPTESSQSETEPSQEVKAEVSQFLDDWKSARESTDFEKYIGFYDRSFYEAEKKMDYEQFVRYKRPIYGKAKNVRLVFSNVRMKQLDEGTVQVAMDQQYSADDYSDFTRKSILLKRSEDGWRIVREGKYI